MHFIGNLLRTPRATENYSTNSALDLLTIPLRRLGVNLSHCLCFWELTSHVREGRLIDGHSDSEFFEVRKLGRETNTVSIHEHKVASLALDLIDLQGTFLLHGHLKLGEEVLAQAHRPPFLHLTDSGDVLVHQTINLGDGAVHLDRLTRENSWERISTKTLTSSSFNWCSANGSECSKEVTDGRQVATLALSKIISDTICGCRSVSLQGEVVIGNLC